MQGFQYRLYGDLKHGLGHQPEPRTSFSPDTRPRRAQEFREIPESLNHDAVVYQETHGTQIEEQRDRHRNSLVRLRLLLPAASALHRPRPFFPAPPR